MFLKLHSFKKLCNFSILKNWLEIDKCTCLCRCTCWPRQPSQLSGCHRGRHGSVYRILGQLPQDLELKKWKQHLKIKIIILTTKPQSKLLKALEDKETERQQQRKWVSNFFPQVLFLAFLGFAFQCSRSVIRWVLLLQKKKAKKLDLLS